MMVAGQLGTAFGSNSPTKIRCAPEVCQAPFWLGKLNRCTASRRKMSNRRAPDRGPWAQPQPSEFPCLGSFGQW